MALWMCLRGSVRANIKPIINNSLIENHILCEIIFIHVFVKRYLIIKIHLYYISHHIILITVKINPGFLMFSKPETQVLEIKS